MADLERWEEIRDEITLPLAQADKRVADTWLDGLNAACKRIADQEKRIGRLEDRADQLTTLVARFADQLDSVGDLVRQADDLLGGSDA